jgi:L-histidine Nalpha-methyltransferase
VQKVTLLPDQLKFDDAVAKAVENGLSQKHKSLPSWLLYDETGDVIFQRIMTLPEYYPTRCELEILQNHKADLAYYFSNSIVDFKLIELGPGDGSKTEILIDHFIQSAIHFQYFPVDISQNILDRLTERLSSRYPGLKIKPVNLNYSEALPFISGDERKVILFMGANIGNLNNDEALDFLETKAEQMRQHDLILIGFDLKKDARIIEKAYDDGAGVTRQFNLNLLSRLNKGLGANFDLTQFEHYPYYDPETGAAKSYLMSLRSQSVYIEALSKAYFFQQWETINTEISQKYDLLMIDKLISSAGLDITDIFFDSQHYFCNVLATKVS